MPPYTGIPCKYQGPQQSSSLQLQVEGVVQSQEVWSTSKWPCAGPSYPIHLEKAAEISRSGPWSWPQTT